MAFHRVMADDQYSKYMHSFQKVVYVFYDASASSSGDTIPLCEQPRVTYTKAYARALKTPTGSSTLSKAIKPATSWHTDL
ncbi:hypothetical protein BGX23_000757, partial [Mortierella sp. AD031]